MKPRYNSTLHFNALVNTQRSEGIINKPLLIFHIALDSLSRRHFIRKLPKTQEFLNDLNNKSKHSVFDFKIHNIQDYASIENQSYVYSGIHYLERAKHKNPFMKDL